MIETVFYIITVAAITGLITAGVFEPNDLNSAHKTYHIRLNICILGLKVFGIAVVWLCINLKYFVEIHERQHKIIEYRECPCKKRYNFKGG